ncbi:pao retrotransposon peptidase [Loa loa]|uniref:Pao retrotransposon peptidase n=1 Tax=Loa loa TaxID=7209 RepID=A0A1S0UMA0_LOALO|nr:pao retrotransposon peptidase [Loa loa]EJD76719.1 pao retrotransposon peptidase [Loa loa]
MSTSLNKSAQPTIDRVIELLEEIKKLDLSLPDRNQPQDQKQQYEIKKRIVKDKVKRFDIYVGTLEMINQKWLDLIQQAMKTAKKEEEQKYEEMFNDKQGILHMIKETIITLNSYYDDLELALQQEKLIVTKGKEIEKPSPAYHSIINLPQLPLPTFSGDPKLWREFWNSFNAAIHLQEIPNIQKLTYLISCLKGESLEAIRGFDIAPENYQLIRQVLIDKYGNPATIKKSLYNEFHSIQRNDKESSRSDGKNPSTILDKVCQMKTERETWTVNRLQFLMTLIQRNEEVNRNQKTQQEPSPKRVIHFQKGRGTSALSITKQFKLNDAKHLQPSNKTKFSKERRPCIFYNKNHWDSECSNCLTATHQFERLTELKACTNCFRTVHATSDCKQRKRTCFHCKGQHNTALCYKKYGSLNNGSNNEETNSTIIINSLNQPINHQGKKVLLICKEIEAVNPTQLEIQEEALVLFDSADKLQIINPTSYDINCIIRQKQLDESEGYWRRPDIIIGADYFFEFMQPYKFHRMSSGFYLLHTNGSKNNQDDEKALEQFKNGITKKNSRYQVCWPWKDSKVNLQHNYGLRYGRLKMLIKRLQANQPCSKSNIIEKVTTNMDQEGIIHYLPHREVLTPRKATTKLRIVYDASAHIKGEKNLNNVLYRGPTTLPDLAATLNYHLETYGSKTALEIKKNLYVDNVILSVSGTEEAFKIKEMKDIFKNASMDIREFFSNDNDFNELIPENDRVEVSQTKEILGINWNPVIDSIGIVLKPWSNQTPTKRTILQLIASQYDPLGFLIPSMLLFKLFLQTLWKRKVSWDQLLENDDIETWEIFTSRWSTKVEEIPRMVIDPECLQQLEIHVFTDASTTAYAAAVYAKQGINTFLIFAKSRVAPVKGITIPKLELLAILIGVRATKFIIKQLEIEDVRVTLWSDSRCALQWIKNRSRLLLKFIQNRIDGGNRGYTEYPTTNICKLR